MVTTVFEAWRAEHRQHRESLANIVETLAEALKSPTYGDVVRLVEAAAVSGTALIDSCINSGVLLEEESGVGITVAGCRYVVWLADHDHEMAEWLTIAFRYFGPLKGMNDGEV